MTSSSAPSTKVPSDAPPPDAEQLVDDPDREDTARALSGPGLTPDERAECERFGAIAGAYVLAGVPVRLAWQRANEWLDEHPFGGMPEGVTVEAGAPERREMRPLFASPHRLDPTNDGDWYPTDKPRRRGTAAREGQCAAAPRQPDSSARASAPKESVMPKPNTDLRDKLRAALELNGPTAPRDLVASLGASVNALRRALGMLVDDGVAEVVGSTNAVRWQIRGDKRASAAASKPRTMADVAAKAAKKTKAPKPKRARRPSVTGDVPVLARQSGVKAVLDALADELRKDFEAKLAALQVLGR